MVSLIIDLKPQEVKSLVALCDQHKRALLAQLCDTPEQANGLLSALDEIHWQLASAGHEGAISALTKISS